MKEMTVQELIDFLMQLPLEYRSKKVMLDQNSPIPELLTDVTALQDEDAILLKG